METVYFVGAGPGDPDLITVRGMRLLEEADLLIYAGSLVNPELVARSGAAEKLNSHGMSLGELVDAMYSAARRGRRVVRLHSGDPALYGAIVEQIADLEALGVTVEVVPGVSSMFGAAAVLRTQLTLRGVSESVIITRPAGATLERDEIPALSRMGATMVIFLGTEHLESITARLECPPKTPAAVVYHATWPDQQVIIGTVEDIARQARDAGITRTALLIVGEVVRSAAAGFEHSVLYS
ncbi:MAG TPA: precorrin-4 C(11)-methyltransferase [Methanoregulaceae archaeon]|nr:precorrin-4 C(11)-methyltransferase [Methanoregulaceae archaeon]HQJ86934.1 precorrin-4 C(11)-methyltransferase [Methanoregulaceae archaeon]